MQHGRQDIADVFAEFYGDLYAAPAGGDRPHILLSTEAGAVPDVEVEEVRD